MSLKKTLANIVLIGESVLGLSGKANAESIESYTLSDSGNPTHSTGYGTGGTQTFTVGATGKDSDFILEKIRLKLSSSLNSGLNPCYVELVRASEPYSNRADWYGGGHLFSKGSFDEGSIEQDSKWVDVPMSSCLLEKGEEYIIILNAAKFVSSSVLKW